MNGVEPGGVRSPCIDVCRLDEKGRRCTGCLRTIDEIAAWPGATDRWKRALLEELAERRLRK